MAQRSAVPSPKVRVPVAPATLIPRERLLRLLDTRVPVQGGTVPDVTLLSAPPGSGKTTLLSTWASRQGGMQDAPPAGRCVAWATLDNDDNDIFLLWSAILAAFEVSGADGEGSALHRLKPPEDASDPGFLAAIVAAFSEFTQPVWLVLDDIHLLHDPAALSSLHLLLRRMPRQLRLVLSGRYEPALNLYRLRLEGRLLEIGPGELSFTREETSTLLSAHGIALSGSELELLLQRTEGWAAGLRMAVMSLASAVNPGELVADFAGDSRTVADYLVGEILSRQPRHIRQFLLATCVPDEFTIELAVALSEREDAGAIVDQLERANALIVRLGRLDHWGSWHRYHTLLRDYLRVELGRHHAFALRRLHRTAAEWFHTHGMTLRALEHAIAAGDTDRATGLVEESGLREVMGGNGAPLRRLLDGLPGAVLERPGVALVAAATALAAGDVPAADARLAHVGVDVTGHETERLRVLHACVRLHRARLGGDMAAALAALTATRAGDLGEPDLDLYALANRGTVRMWLGSHDDAEYDLQRAAALAVALERDYLALQCMSHLASVAAARSDLVDMAERAAQAIDFATPRGWTLTPHCAYAYIAAMWSAYQHLDHEAAQRYASLAVEVLEGRSDITTELAAHALWAVVAFDHAEDRRGMVEELRRHWQRLGAEQIKPEFIAHAAPVEQRLALRVGEPAWAAEVSERARRLLGAGGESSLMEAVLRAHRGRAEDARRLLRPVLDGETPSLAVMTVIDAWLLEAVLADASGERYRSHEALRQALDLAAPRQALRPFADAGQPIRDLLIRGTGRFGRHERFAAEVLAALPPDQPGPTETLTPRELELLAELPSLRTVDEIAAALFVSVNTVKTHLRGIYRKLRVNTRRDAVAVARRRGLL